MNLDELKDDIANGNLNHTALKSMLVQDLGSRLVSNKSEGNFFTRILSWIFGGGCSRTSCTSMCSSCSSGCASGCSNSSCSNMTCSNAGSSNGCNPSCTTCSNGGSII